ncbi:p-cumate dioxygenase [Paenibacillus beijingensis]|uniref:p-cumate dioxygenase n=2 Tax=Paenibacillus beijingensis TaxID=1126833 RepID=A0A0D5NQI5_9BACL|nr:p-cumate dioxygenase [Paenibacillus beijingensis]
METKQLQTSLSEPLIIMDEDKNVFKVNRKVFTDMDIFEMEKKKIFDKCWFYLGHESELPKPGDFINRRVAGRPLIFTKDSDGNINVFSNACPHRGSIVCREHKGNSKTFQCFYHAWTFNNKGKLVGMPGKDAYPSDFNCDESMNLQKVPRMENYKGFYFVNFDYHAMSLEDYLGNAKEYFDLVVDQAETGLEVFGEGSQEYSMRCNWKLLSENAVDNYHTHPTHKTYFDFLNNTNIKVSEEPMHGVGRDLGNGHGVMEYASPWGRPVAKWIPAWGEEGKKELDEKMELLIARVGEERAQRIAKRNRNVIVFPNMIISDIMSLTVRTFFPVSPDYMEISIWAMAPKEEGADMKGKRLNNLVEFVGPGGFGTPDDIEALELCQEGYKNNKEVQWNDISKGMIKETPSFDDELQMRAFWKQYNEIMTKE